MIRPSIPVRDGILAPYRARLPGARRLPHPTVSDYIAGWRWGFVCGLFAGALAAGIVWGCMSPSNEVHTVGSRVYDGATWIGVCGNPPPAPGTLPQPHDGVDITWYPTCPK